MQPPVRVADDEKTYIYEKRLGTGSYGTVDCIRCEQDNKKYAAKYLDSKNVLLLNIEQEISIFQKMDNEFILKMFDYKKTKSTFDDTTGYTLIMEYAPYGNLYCFIQNRQRLKSQSSLLENENRWIFYQVASGVAYLHSKKIVHQDLKLENFLIIGFDLECYPIIKIGDFGFSISKEEEEKERNGWGPQCGTPLYLAPEVWFPKMGGRNYPSDIWSLGIIFYELFVSLNFPKHLYVIRNELKTPKLLRQKLIAIHKLSQNKQVKWSREARDLYKKMTIMEPNKRISCEQILKHAFLKEIDLC